MGDVTKTKDVDFAGGLLHIPVNSGNYLHDVRCHSGCLRNGEQLLFGLINGQTLLQQQLLSGKEGIKRAFRNAQFTSQIVHGCAFDALPEKHRQGRTEDALSIHGRVSLTVCPSVM